MGKKALGQLIDACFRMVGNKATVLLADAISFECPFLRASASFHASRTGSSHQNQQANQPYHCGFEARVIVQEY
jgi:hypothetical protein